MRQMFQDYFAHLRQQPQRVEYLEKYAQIADVPIRQGSFTHGTFVVGSYGQVSTLVNTRSGRTTHERIAEEADMVPLHFHMDLTGPRHGILVMLRYNAISAHNFLAASFNRFFRQRFPGHRVDFLPLLTNAQIRRIIGAGSIVGISLVKQGVPADLFDTRASARERERRAYTELSYHFSESAPASLRAKFLRAFGRTQEIHQMFPSDFDYDTIKVQYRSPNGGYRTWDLSRPEVMRPWIDVTGQVGPRDEYPRYDLVRNQMDELLEELRAEVNQ